MVAVDITPLLRTKANWPKFWRGVITGDNGEYVTLIVDADVKLAIVRMFHDGGRVELRLAKNGPDGMYVEYSTFDEAIKSLEEMVSDGVV